MARAVTRALGIRARAVTRAISIRARLIPHHCRNVILGQCRAVRLKEFAPTLGNRLPKGGGPPPLVRNTVLPAQGPP
eukprot:11220875-Lingulodinium_polyedra.AAC.1